MGKTKKNADQNTHTHTLHPDNKLYNAPSSELRRKRTVEEKKKKKDRNLKHFSNNRTCTSPQSASSWHTLSINPYAFLRAAEMRGPHGVEEREGHVTARSSSTSQATLVMTSKGQVGASEPLSATWQRQLQWKERRGKIPKLPEFKPMKPK